MSETTVASFMVRFVQENEPEPETAVAVPPWRGVIRHIQSSEEIRFTQLADALKFMAAYIDIAPDQPHEETE